MTNGQGSKPQGRYSNGDPCEPTIKQFEVTEFLIQLNNLERKFSYELEA